jgi:hypothetical protein
LVVVVLAACSLVLGAAGSAVAQQGPPPQGPRLLSDPAALDGGLSVNVIRSVLQQQGDEVIESFNGSSDHQLSWSSGAEPVDCGYECVGPPGISATDHLDQPNQYVATIRGHLDFDIDIDDVPFDRTIRTNVTIDVICSGWRDGSGSVVVVARADPPFIAGDTGLVEDILDFVLLPANLSRAISDGVEAQLPGGSLSSTALGSECDSLGVVSNYESGDWGYDSVYWQEPPDRPFGLLRPGQTLLFEMVTVDLASVARRQTLSTQDAGQGVYFDIYVNGQFVGVPGNGFIELAPGQSTPLDLAPIVLSARDADDLQVILVDSLGGSGWAAFGRDEGYGEGEHTLTTHRTEFRPPPDLPDIGGFPGSTKPVPFDVQEFELLFTVDYIPRPTVLEPQR